MPHWRHLLNVGGPILLYSKTRCPVRFFTSIEKESPSTNTLSDIQVLRHLWAYLWPKRSDTLSSTYRIKIGLKWRVVGAMTVLFVGKLMNIQVPYLFKRVIDSTTTENLPVVPSGEPFHDNEQFIDFMHQALYGTIGTTSSTQIILYLCIAYFLARGGSALMNELRNVIFSKVTETCNRALTLDTLRQFLEEKNTVNFYKFHKVPMLARSMERANRGIRFLVSSVILNLTPTLFEVFLVSGLLYVSFGGWYAALTLGTVSLYSVWTLGMTQWRTAIRRKMQQIENRMTNELSEVLSSHDVIKVCKSSIYEVSRYETLLRDYEKLSLKTASSLGVLNFGQSAIFTGAMTVTLYWTGLEVQHGSLTAGDMVMLNGLLMQLSLPLNFLGSMYREVKQSLLDIGQLISLKLGSCDNALTNTTVSISETLNSNALVLKNVSYEASDGQVLLDDINLMIPYGQKVAIVGASGCGKSTLLRLIAGLLVPTKGSIARCNNRSRIAFVMQEGGLFVHRSLRENIMYPAFAYATVMDHAVTGVDLAADNASKDIKNINSIIEAACEKAQLTSFLSTLKDRLDTPLSCLSLSGGEKQRILLARIFYGDADCILLDEATSALDTLTERLVINELLQLKTEPLAQAASIGTTEVIKSKYSLDPNNPMQLASNLSTSYLIHSKTLLIVAHRLSFLPLMDRIIVLDSHGKIIQDGAHQDLLNSPGLYSLLWSQYDNDKSKN